MYVFGRATASSHAHSGDSKYRMPSRILATRICTCVQSLRSGDEGACVAEHLEWEQRSRPEKAGEDSVPRPKSSGRCRRNARYLPDPNAVRHSTEFPGPKLLFRASYMGPRAFHVDDQHIAAANVADIQAGGDLGNDSCRGARMASKVGR